MALRLGPDTRFYGSYVDSHHSKQLVGRQPQRTFLEPRRIVLDLEQCETSPSGSIYDLPRGRSHDRDLLAIFRTTGIFKEKAKEARASQPPMVHVAKEPPTTHGRTIALSPPLRLQIFAARNERYPEHQKAQAYRRTPLPSTFANVSNRWIR